MGGGAAGSLTPSWSEGTDGCRGVGLGEGLPPHGHWEGAGMGEGEGGAVARALEKGLGHSPRLDFHLKTCLFQNWQ